MNTPGTAGTAGEVLSPNLWLQAFASNKNNRYGEHLSLHCWYPEPNEYTPDLAALRLLAPDAPEDMADPQQWLFLDTETTGLAGGTGTYPFLVGVAYWCGGGLEVEQLFMREYSEESSLLMAYWSPARALHQSSARPRCLRHPDSRSCQNRRDLVITATKTIGFKSAPYFVITS